VAAGVEGTGLRLEIGTTPPPGSPQPPTVWAGEGGEALARRLAAALASDRALPAIVRVVLDGHLANDHDLQRVAVGLVDGLCIGLAAVGTYLTPYLIPLNNHVMAACFMMFALLALFAFFDLLGQLDDLRPGAYSLPQALAFVALSLPSRSYELMPIAALIGAIFALSRLASNSEFTIMRVSGMSTRDLVFAVVRVGLIFVGLTYAFGELVAPASERKAQEVRAGTRGQGVIGSKLRSGVWVRDTVRDASGEVQRWRFINVAVVRQDGTSSNWKIFEFDRDFRLLSIGTAAAGRFVQQAGAPSWQLTDVVETRLPVVSTTDSGPADLRTARCSSVMLVYCTGISQPPNSMSLPPSLW